MIKKADLSQKCTDIGGMAVLAGHLSDLRDTRLYTSMPARFGNIRRGGVLLDTSVIMRGPTGSIVQISEKELREIRGFI